MVNEKINSNLPVYAFVAPLEQASKTNGFPLCRRLPRLSEQNGSSAAAPCHACIRASILDVMSERLVVPVHWQKKSSVTEHGKFSWLVAVLKLVVLVRPTNGSMLSCDRANTTNVYRTGKAHPKSPQRFWREVS